MGIIWSLLGYYNSGRTDDPDPDTGLTSRDRYLVQSSWAIVRKNPTENGVALLNLYFTKYPHAQQLFPFRDIPLKDLSNNKRYQAHCNSVIYGVSAVVDALNEPPLLICILKKLGETHAPRKVTEKLFMELKGTIIELFTTFMKKNEIDAWEKTLNVAFEVINQGLREQLETK